ncbi:MAG TPA: serpin family protein [Acidimicrobiia bacterium]
MKRTLWVVLAVLLAAACGTSNTGLDRPPPTTASRGTVVFPANAQLATAHVPRSTPDASLPSELVDDNTRFAFALYRRLAAGDQGNLVFSPSSISNAISMLEGGARGATLRQIDTAMNFTLPGSNLQDAFSALDQMLAAPRRAAPGETGTPLQLEQTDAVWGQRGYPFVQEYLDLLARDYGAGLRLADFVKDAEAERVKINTYVANATHGRIKQLFPKGVIDNMTRMVLVNAIWFKGDWVTPFAPRSSNAPFARLDGSTVSVPWMTGGQASRALRAPYFDAVEIPYVGGASMVVIAPKQARFGKVEGAFDYAVAQLDAAPQKLSYEVSMPKFDFSSQFSLDDTLSAMGMRDVFDPERADLSGIGGDPGDLFVSDVVHKATIKVDEKGTEAAAATGIAVETMSLPPTIEIDRPFLFAIRDDKTGAILFTGRVLDPTQH